MQRIEVTSSTCANGKSQQQQKGSFFLLISAEKLLSSLICIGNPNLWVSGLKLVRDLFKYQEVYHWLELFSEVGFSLPVKFLARFSLPFLFSCVILFFTLLAKKMKETIHEDQPGLCLLYSQTLEWTQGKGSYMGPMRDFLQYLENGTSFCLLTLQVQI